MRSASLAFSRRSRASPRSSLISERAQSGKVSRSFSDACVLRESSDSGLLGFWPWSVGLLPAFSSGLAATGTSLGTVIAVLPYLNISFAQDQECLSVLIYRDISQGSGYGY